MANVEFDDKDFQEKVKQLESIIFPKATKKALSDIGNEVLRLSASEVPHDTGTLQGTGHVEEDGDGYLVGYNTRYAARLHEHPDYHFQKGRKGKYLEDPIKNNMPTFLKYATNAYQEALR